ncbi:MAG: ribonuclease R [Proteobacteria bacterium]|nr:ribonuclease R [Pseudomonadota bacterium]
MAQNRQKPELPTREAILKFIRDSPSPVGKREIGRAFRLSSQDRALVADMLVEMEEDGSIRRGRGRRYGIGNLLPSVTVLEIAGFDSDGDAIVKPTDERLSDQAPRIRLILEGGRGRAPGLGDRILARLSRQSSGSYTARIMRVLEQRPARVFGVFRTRPDGGRLEPADRRYKSEFLIAEANTGEAEDGELVACETLPGRAFGLPLARVVGRIGHESDPRSVSPLVIAKSDIPESFTPDALRQAERAEAAPMDDREDFRALPLVTIDDEHARDFDDAVWAEADKDPDNPGGWHLVVAIADVGWYVHPDAPLDTDSHLRGNSVYLPDRVIPMLPEALSNGWCSLIPDEDRPCLAVHMWIDANGQKRRHTFHRAMMRSAARLTYNQVQRCRDSGPDEEIATIPPGLLDPLYGAFTALLKSRESRGALDLDLPERRIVLAEDGSVARIDRRVRLDSHRLIEEFMILANISAAETLEAVGQPCMYRLHDDPALDRVAALRSYLQTLGLRLAGGQAVRPRHFAQLVNRIAGKPFAGAVQDAILRSQAKAVYSPENIGHFGLALRHYAHFTSPIRRYSDLLVHRALIAGLRLGAGALKHDAGLLFSDIGEHISMTERRAVAAERECFDRLCSHYLADKIGAVFAGRVTGVERFGLFVVLDESGANGLVPVSALGDAYYTYDETRRSLRSDAADEEFRLGDALSLRLAESNPLTGSLSLELADRAPRSEAKRPGRRGHQPRRPVPRRKHQGNKR